MNWSSSCSSFDLKLINPSVISLHWENWRNAYQRQDIKFEIVKFEISKYEIAKFEITKFEIIKSQYSKSQVLTTIWTCFSEKVQTKLTNSQVSSGKLQKKFNFNSKLVAKNLNFTISNFVILPNEFCNRHIKYIILSQRYNLTLLL